MSETIVTPNDVTVVVDDAPGTIVTQNISRQTIVTGIMGPPGTAATTVSQLRDVDVSDVTTGSALIFNAQIGKWVSTTLLEQQTVECGQF